MNSDNPNFGSAMTPASNETPQARKPWRTPKVILETVVVDDTANNIQNNSDFRHAGYGTGS